MRKEATRRAEERQDENEALKREVEALKRDLAKLSETLAKMGERKFEEGVAAAKVRAAETVGDEPIERIRELADEGEALVEALKKQHKEHPLGTLLVAAGIGFLLGRALGGR
ncbi:hypothetical protein [Hydrogenimonas sp.]